MMLTQVLTDAADDHVHDTSLCKDCELIPWQQMHQVKCTVTAARLLLLLILMSIVLDW